MTQQEEQILWQKFRAGSEDAFTQLTSRYYRKLVHYGLKFTPNVSLVEDAIQDLLIYLWLHRASLGDTPSVKFYLLKAFRHQLFKALKRNGPTIQLDEQIDGQSADFSLEDAYIQQESENQFQRRLSDMLAQLTDRQREVIYLRFYQEMRPEEIAALLNIQPQSVSNILQRAFASLRENWPYPLILLLLLFF